MMVLTESPTSSPSLYSVCRIYSPPSLHSRNQNDEAAKDHIQGDVGNVIENNDRKGCTYKEFLACNPKEYDRKGVKYTAGSFVGKALTLWNSHIRTLGREVAVESRHGRAGHATYTDRFHELSRMVEATKPKTIQKAVQIAGTLTDEALRNGSIKKNHEKRRNGGEPSKDRNVRDDNKRTRTGNAFATTTKPVTRENTSTVPKCTTCNAHHPPGVPCRTCFNCNHPGHFSKDYRDVPRNVNPVNARNPTARACYECGSTNHIRSWEPREQGMRKGIHDGSRGGSLGLEYRDGGSFDVIIGMDWLSNHKVEIIYHEKVVRIPLLDGKEIEFWIELIPMAISVVKSLYRLAPSELEELSRFAGYYCRFIKKFPKTAKPLTVLTQKSKTFDWGDEQEYVFQTLKDKLCNAPVLALSDRPKDFVVYCDASGLGLGCVLMQRELFSDYDCEIRYHPGKANVVADAMSRKERVKPKRVRSMNMTLQSSIKDKILAAQKEAPDKLT
nr:hypothetical protein [Tanacetum cinerariifolium]